MKLKLLISYVGTQYRGWQIQEHASLRMPTIQGELERAFMEVTGERVRVIGASRTDSGVHAEGQVAHCSISFAPKNIHWQKAINTRLPHDIRVKAVEEVDESFHAQFDAKGKEYTYSLWNNSLYIPPRQYPFSWMYDGLDYSKIEEALPFLIGKHDFASFQNTGTELEHTVRTIKDISFEHISQEEVIFTFKGNGFLKQMIRNLMGLLIFVGRKRITPEQVKDILEAKQRNNTLPTAPARGLTLKKVFYETT